MPVFAPVQLARWAAGRWTTVPAAPLAGFAIDSRTVAPGEIFVALKTAARDGHDFLAAAAAAGAGAALVAQPDPALALPQLVVADPLAAFQAIAREHRRAFTGPVIGITGSAGKTSTKNLLALLLGAAGASGPVLATAGNLNNHLGVPLTLTRLDPARHKFAVVEAGINALGDMIPLAAMIEPDLALTTLIAPAHIKELGSLDGVAREKSRLSAATRPTGIAIFPTQTAAYPAFRDLAVRQMVVEPAEVLRPAAPPRDKVYFAVTQRGDATAIALAYGEPPPVTFTLRRVTDGMAQNAVLAICAALWLGISPEVIQSRLATYAPAPLRGEWRRTSTQLLYLDCYNANPASMLDALATFCAVAPAAEPRLFVIGGMEELGADAPRHHRALGRALRLRAEDEVVTIGDHAAEVRAGLLETGYAPTQITVAANLAEITVRLAAFRGAVFVKGSRRYQLERTLELAGGFAPASAHA
jgi:UDP-N-acetylmuramoyl-tripeptide--D-alanyl-D-alanine ligase